MKRLWVRMAILLVVVAAAGAAALLLKDQAVSLEYVREHREELLLRIGNHYLPAVAIFILLYFATALFLPGALVLTVAGGLLFGTVPAALYANLGGTAGAVVAFLAARVFLGHQIQERFKRQLERFNREMAHHGPNYLLVLRIIPVAPFFVINYCAAITRIPLKTFVWTTSLGMLPGGLVHTYVGEQLRHVKTAADLLSGRIVLALALLALLALAPVILHHLPSYRK